MPRSPANAAVSVERFFQFSLLGMVSWGFLAVAGSGFLDTPTTALTAVGLLLRGLLVGGLVRLHIPDRAVTAATIAYIGFFPLDYLYVSQNFVPAVVHLIFFLAVIKVLTARNARDYAFTATVAFLEILAAAILSVHLNFFVFLALFLLFAMAALTSSEIRRAHQGEVIARNGLRRFHLRLAAMAGGITLGILGLTGGLFFMLPRTAEAALERLVSHRIHLPGFSSQVKLGEIGEVKNTSRPVMHVRLFTPAPAQLKWRGLALAHFDGRRWFNPTNERESVVRVDAGRAYLADYVQRMREGQRISYRVDVDSVDTDTLFFAGVPEVLDIRQRSVRRTPGGGYRAGFSPGRALRYAAWSYVAAGPLEAAPVEEIRKRYLQLPALDARIPELAARVTEGRVTALARARAIESHLRTQYGYTLELLEREVPDPLAHFLFERRKGHCEYFASAMTVMLRAQGVPARLVNGFQSGIWNPISEMYLIRAADAHTWVEALIPEHGWMTFDPTPPDPNPPSATLWSQLALYVDAAETFWREWVLSYDLGRQMLLAQQMEQSSRRFRLRLPEIREWKPAATAWLKRHGAPALLLGLLLAAAVKLGPRAWRRWRLRRGVERVRRGQASVADATTLYLRMLQILRRKGFDKPAWFTPNEFADSLPHELHTLVAQFTAAYNDVRFGGRLEAAPQLPHLLDQLEHTA